MPWIDKTDETAAGSSFFQLYVSHPFGNIINEDLYTKTK